MHTPDPLEMAPLGETVKGKDLEALVDRRLSKSMQCHTAVNKARKILSCIKKGIYSRYKSVILPLYKHWSVHIWNMQISFGHQSSENKLLKKNEFSEGQQN